MWPACGLMGGCKSGLVGLIALGLLVVCMFRSGRTTGAPLSVVQTNKLAQLNSLSSSYQPRFGFPMLLSTATIRLLHEAGVHVTQAPVAPTPTPTGETAAQRLLREAGAKVPTESPLNHADATNLPTPAPTSTLDPTTAPTDIPSQAPTSTPTEVPTATTASPTEVPTETPSQSPTFTPTDAPSLKPTGSPTTAPTILQGPYASGSRVSVQWLKSRGGDDQWYPGTVKSCTSADCELDWDDGAAATDVSAAIVHTLPAKMNDGSACKAQCAQTRKLKNTARCDFCGKTGYCCEWGDQTSGCWGTAGTWGLSVCVYKQAK